MKIKSNGLCAQLARHWQEPWFELPNDLCGLVSAMSRGLFMSLFAVVTGALFGSLMVALPLAGLAVWLQTGYFVGEAFAPLAVLCSAAAILPLIVYLTFGHEPVRVVREALRARAERYCPRVEYTA